MTARRKRSLLVGLTGTIASGKSEVTRMMAARGAVVISADAVARAVVEPKTRAWKKIVAQFGREILNNDATINRRALAAVVFADVRQRKLLEEITHPEITKAVTAMIRDITKKHGGRIIIIEAPLLFEAGWDAMVDRIIMVTAKRSVRAQRLKKRDAMTDKEIRQRFAAQGAQAEKRSGADFILKNDTTREYLAVQVKKIWDVLTNELKYV
jgi:dephospho-CoA kinase